MECDECNKEWFDIPLVFTLEDPVGFKDWCNRIEQCKYTLYRIQNS